MAQSKLRSNMSDAFKRKAALKYAIGGPIYDFNPRAPVSMDSSGAAPGMTREFGSSAASPTVSLVKPMPAGRPNSFGDGAAGAGAGVSGIAEPRVNNGMPVYGRIPSPAAKVAAPATMDIGGAYPDQVSRAASRLPASPVTAPAAARPAPAVPAPDVSRTPGQVAGNVMDSLQAGGRAFANRLTGAVLPQPLAGAVNMVGNAGANALERTVNSVGGAAGQFAGPKLARAASTFGDAMRTGGTSDALQAYSDASALRAPAPGYGSDGAPIPHANLNAPRRPRPPPVDLGGGLGNSMDLATMSALGFADGGAVSALRMPDRAGQADAIMAAAPPPAAAPVAPAANPNMGVQLTPEERALSARSVPVAPVVRPAPAPVPPAQAGASPGWGATLGRIGRLFEDGGLVDPASRLRRDWQARPHAGYEDLHHALFDAAKPLPPTTEESLRERTAFKQQHIENITNRPAAANADVEDQVSRRAAQSRLRPESYAFGGSIDGFESMNKGDIGGSLSDTDRQLRNMERIRGTTETGTSTLPAVTPPVAPTAPGVPPATGAPAAPAPLLNKENTPSGQSLFATGGRIPYYDDRPMNGSAASYMTVEPGQSHDLSVHPSRSATPSAKDLGSSLRGMDNPVRAAYAGGGAINAKHGVAIGGHNIQKQGPDTQHILAAKGEYVLPKATVDAMGGPEALDNLVRSTNGREPNHLGDGQSQLRAMDGLDLTTPEQRAKLLDVHERLMSEGAAEDMALRQTTPKPKAMSAEMGRALAGERVPQPMPLPQLDARTANAAALRDPTPRDLRGMDQLPKIDPAPAPAPAAASATAPGGGAPQPQPFRAPPQETVAGRVSGVPADQMPPTRGMPVVHPSASKPQYFATESGAEAEAAAARLAGAMNRGTAAAAEKPGLLSRIGSGARSALKYATTPEGLGARAASGLGGFALRNIALPVAAGMGAQSIYEHGKEIPGAVSDWLSHGGPFGDRKFSDAYWDQMGVTAAAKVAEMKKNGTLPPNGGGGGGGPGGPNKPGNDSVLRDGERFAYAGPHTVITEKGRGDFKGVGDAPAGDDPAGMGSTLRALDMYRQWNNEDLPSRGEGPRGRTWQEETDAYNAGVDASRDKDEMIRLNRTAGPNAVRNLIADRETRARTALGYSQLGETARGNDLSYKSSLASTQGHIAAANATSQSALARLRFDMGKDARDYTATRFDKANEQKNKAYDQQRDAVKDFEGDVDKRYVTPDGKPDPAKGARVRQAIYGMLDAPHPKVTPEMRAKAGQLMQSSAGRTELFRLADLELQREAELNSLNPLNRDGKIQRGIRGEKAVLAGSLWDRVLAGGFEPGSVWDTIGSNSGPRSTGGFAGTPGFFLPDAMHATEAGHLGAEAERRRREQ